MYPVSIAYKNAVTQPSRAFNAKVLIRDVEYIDENIVEIVLNETVNPDDTFSLGSAASTRLDLTVIDIADVIFENATIKPYIGLDVGGTTEYVPLGVFTVDSLSKIKTKTKLTCFDNMIKLERPYFSNLTYPAGINMVAQEIATKAGVILATTLPSTLIDEITGYTLREAIGFVASFVGGFARFNRDGELEIVSYQSTDVSITADHYSDLQTAEKLFAIGKLTCKVGDSEDGPILISSGTGINAIQFENPIMTQEQLDTIYATLSTLAYMPYEMKWQSNPALQAGDKVQVTDAQGNSYNTLIMEQQLRYTGGLSATAAAKGKTENAQEFQSSGPLTQKLERYAIEAATIRVALIDKANISDLEAVEAKIDNLVVEEAQIADASITNAKIRDAEITGAKIAQATIGTANIELGAITTALIGEGAVETAQIADGSITDAKIVGLTANKITAGKIDAAEIEVVNLKAANITVGTINGQQITDGAITNEKVAPGAITNEKIAPGISGDKIEAGSIKEAAMNWTMHLLF